MPRATGVAPRWGYARPIIAGIAILVAGLVPWMLLAQLNHRVRPEMPWAAAVTILYLVALIAWLHGFGPPRYSAAGRRRSLRLTPRASIEDAEGVSATSLVLLLLVLYAAWTALSRQAGVPDLTAYPTTAYRWSMFLMGGVTAGLVEEVAFRGYMQSGIEQFDPRNAVWITSAVFVAAHLTQGIGAVLTLGPGLFVASMLYGTLARRTGSIAPGIVIHVVGDLTRTFVGVLHGDVGLLFVP